MNLNLTAPVCSSGYANMAMALLQALDQAGHEVALFPLGQIEAEPDWHDFLQRALGRAPLFFPRAPSLRVFHQNQLAQHVGKGLHAAYPIFELDTFTDVERHHLDAQDVLFVASTWAKGVVENNGIKTPVVVAPFGVRRDVFEPSPLPESRTTTFLHAGKRELRKGVYDVVEAFDRAFTPGDDVRLLLHIHNPFIRPDVGHRQQEEFLHFLSSKKMAGKIHLTEGRFQTQREVADLMRAADCGLFPSRAEGWNMELSEMLAMGRHCVATNYSGHTEYVTPESCRLIEADRLVTAYDGVYFHGQGRWAHFGDAQLEQLVLHLRAVHQEKQGGALSLNQAGVERMREFTWARTADIVAGALT